VKGNQWMMVVEDVTSQVWVTVDDVYRSDLVKLSHHHQMIVLCFVQYYNIGHCLHNCYCVKIYYFVSNDHCLRNSNP